MAYFKEQLYADVAQVQHSSLNMFGSGRLIGRNLVLTARHVVTLEGAATAEKEGWQVRLIAGRPDPRESSKWVWIDASVVWDGKDTLDLALLELHPSTGTQGWEPKLRLRIGRIDKVQRHSVLGLGFPRGARLDNKRMQFAPWGQLDDADPKSPTLSFSIDLGPVGRLCRHED